MPSAATLLATQRGSASARRGQSHTGALRPLRPGAFPRCPPATVSLLSVPLLLAMCSLSACIIPAAANAARVDHSSNIDNEPTHCGRPTVLFASIPFLAHSMPVALTAAELASRGDYDTVFASIGLKGGFHGSILDVLRQGGVGFVEAGSMNATKHELLPNREKFQTKELENQGYGDTVGLILSFASILEEGLHEQFDPIFFPAADSAGAATPPNARPCPPAAVVCDLTTAGCLQYLTSVNDRLASMGLPEVPLVLNSPDIMSALIRGTGGYAPFPIDPGASVLAGHDRSSAVADLLAGGPIGAWSRLWAWLNQVMVPGVGTTLLSAYYQYHGRGRIPSLREAVVLQNTFMAAEYPALVPTNVVFTGPILAPQPFDALSDDLEAWLTASDSPAVYVSMGSLFDITTPQLLLPVARGLLDAGVRVLWKSSAPDQVTDIMQSAGLPVGTESLRVTKWVNSQFSVIVHPAVHVFISHCGTTSVFESLNMSTPVICIPMFWNQFAVGLQLTDDDLAVAVVHKFSPTLQADLRHLVTRMLDPAQRARSLARVKVLQRHMRMHAGAVDAANQLDLILLERSTAFRVAAQMPLYVDYGLDVGLLVGLLCALLLRACMCCCTRLCPSCCCSSCCCSCRRGRPSSSQDHEKRD